MKGNDLQKMQLQELSVEEMTQINGGVSILAAALIFFAIGFVVSILDEIGFITNG